MKVKDIIEDVNKKEEDLSLTDFLNYVKNQGYIVYGNEKHWIGEYQAYLQSKQNSSK